ncbi:hypothetical protein [Streptomyces broussonetiae]|uniref:XRE family transcriptional regulator n=1 Tax=Streptomyces broussonetiae TaxID=2686304 RepID=A0ABV5EDG4_9ACTN
MAKSRTRAGTPAGIETCLRALRRRNIEGPKAVIRAFRSAGITLDWSESSVRSMLNGHRDPKPAFVRALARLADLPASEVFVEMGWLPAEEASAPRTGHLVRQLRDGIAAMGRIPREWETAWSDRAPAAAVAAVLSTEYGARRFTAELSAVSSGEIYPTVVLDVAEFRLRPGRRALPLPEARALAEQAQVWDTLPLADGPHADYWSTRLELTALAHRALKDRGECSWQGEPGAHLWLEPCDGHRPRHLLVQDRAAAVERPTRVAYTRMPGQAVPPLVVIGRRPLAGGAAALLADGLGMQYVLPRSDAEVTSDGQVVPVRRERLSGRLQSWLMTVDHLRARHDTAVPWPAVVLTRPYVFADDDRALRALEHLPARVVFVRPAERMLHWWAARQAQCGARSEGWVEREWRLYAAIDKALRARPADHTLTLTVPEPDTPLPVTGWGWPAAVSDLQPRLAWAVLGWLDRTVNRHGPRLTEGLLPGPLKEWAPTLRDDPEVPVLLTR